MYIVRNNSFIDNRLIEFFRAYLVTISKALAAHRSSHAKAAAPGNEFNSRIYKGRIDGDSYYSM